MSESLKVDSIVVALVERITEAGIFVVLLEYDRRMAFVSVQEMSQRKSSSLAKHSPVGSICAFRVLTVTPGGIDLSRRKIDAIIASDAVNKYIKSTVAVSSACSAKALIIVPQYQIK